MSKKKYCLLRMINADNNNNKDYEMVQQDDDHFKASWGRINSTKMSKVYSMSVWDSIYNKKVREGYTDVTTLVAVVKEEVSKYSDISDEEVKKLVDQLMHYANEYVKKTYEVDKKEVTVNMVKLAQELIDNLSKKVDNVDIDGFNHIYQKLMTVIPRKMQSVAACLASNTSSGDELAQIVRDEQATLDTLKSVCDFSHENAKTNKPTILEALGLKIRPCTDKEIAKIKEKLAAESAIHFDKAFRIESERVENKFNEYCKKNGYSNKDIHFLYHGTRNQNVWSIMQTSLSLNPNAPITGKMFGYGLYLAPRAKKSIGYTSLRGSFWVGGSSDTGYLFVMKAAYKKPYDVYTHKSEYMRYTEKDIKRLGADAMYAHAGSMLRNDEIIVYNEGAITPRYLIQLK